jgi:hypothetical protein
MQRLWLIGLIACRSASASWCEDEPILVSAEDDQIQVMREGGDVIEHYSCGCEKLSLHTVLVSPDARWIVASGNEYVSPQVGDVGRTCIIDRATKHRRLLEKEFLVTGFDHRSQRIGGVLGAFARDDAGGEEVLDLLTGERREDKSTKYGWPLPGDRIMQPIGDGEEWRPTIVDRASSAKLREFPATRGATVSEDGTRVVIVVDRGVEIFDASSGARVGEIRDLDGTRGLAISNDGRRLAAWTPLHITFGDAAEAADPPPPPFSVDMWDVTTGQRVWRQPREQLSGYHWKFSPDGTRLLADDTRSQLSLRADTGEFLPLAPVPWGAMTMGNSCPRSEWPRRLARATIGS